MALKTKLSALTLLVLCVIANSAGTIAARADACRKERRSLVAACSAVIARRPPSAYCCKLIRAAHVSCVCPVITPKLAPLIDFGYAVKVLQRCGRPVPHHFKCGSITTP